MERPQLKLGKKDEICLGDLCLEMGMVLFATLATLIIFMMLSLLAINLGV